MYEEFISPLSWKIDHGRMTMPNWLLVVLMDIVGIVAIGAGVLLGKKYAGLGEETVKTTINISLYIENHELDLRIPNQVTLVRLKALLEPILREERLLQYEAFELVIENKKIVVNDQQPLADYPLSDGDCFRVSFR